MPKLVLTTYKISDLPREPFEIMEDWINWNPEYSYHFFNDTEVDRFMKTYFDDRVRAIMNNFPNKIMRSDLFKYSAIYVYGGIYPDTDLKLLIPARKFAHAPFQRTVVGLESN